ncbi:hypothetical protein FHG87_007797 [Trinorchestia longiramus]|nr:hypothetical protein FHG87_007797 [Trinorchestia longiramus]
MSELEAIASTLSHDIIAINETWLDLNGRHLPAEVSIKGYVLHNVDKPSHSNRGGGSLIYVKEKLQPQIKTKRATEKLEILHLNIQPQPILKDKIATATDHHIPRKRIRPTNNPPWFSQEIKCLINARQHSYRKLKRYQTEPHCQEHIHACRALGQLVSESACERKDPGSNPAADMVDAARNTAWELGKTTE